MELYYFLFKEIEGLERWLMGSEHLLHLQADLNLVPSTQKAAHNP